MGETREIGDSRPSDYAPRTISEQSPDAVWGPDNSVARRPPPGNCEHGVLLYPCGIPMD